MSSGGLRRLHSRKAHIRKESVKAPPEQTTPPTPTLKPSLCNTYPINTVVTVARHDILNLPNDSMVMIHIYMQSAHPYNDKISHMLLPSVKTNEVQIPLRREGSFRLEYVIDGELTLTRLMFVYGKTTYIAPSPHRIISADQSVETAKRGEIHEDPQLIFSAYRHNNHFDIGETVRFSKEDLLIRERDNITQIIVSVSLKNVIESKDVLDDDLTMRFTTVGIHDVTYKIRSAQGFEATASTQIKIQLPITFYRDEHGRRLQIKHYTHKPIRKNMALEAPNVDNDRWLATTNDLVWEMEPNDTLHMFARLGDDKARWRDITYQDIEFPLDSEPTLLCYRVVTQNSCREFTWL